MTARFIKHKLGNEAKMLAGIFVLLSLPILIFVIQSQTSRASVQASPSAILSLDLLYAQRKDNGIWQLQASPFDPKPQLIAVNLTTGSEPVNSVSITLAYDPTVFSFISTESFQCINPDGSPSSLPFRTKPMMDGAGTLSFSCGVDDSGNTVSIPVETYSTVTVATITAIPRRTARHSTFSFIRNNMDIFGKTGISTHQGARSVNTIDATIDVMSN